MVAEYEKQIIAGNIIAVFGDMATYVHGASSSEYRNVMAPYLLQWHAMKFAKSLDRKYYDLHGIEERYPGVARFKQGFGGNEIQYPGTHDLVYQPIWYNVYKAARHFRRKAR
jgi:lipid II:glycine glycyltransferase (peptidoglycan interpeptide bridge formation enzyme)